MGLHCPQPSVKTREPEAETSQVRRRTLVVEPGLLPRFPGNGRQCTYYIRIWVVVKIMVPFGVPTLIRHLLFRVPKKGP